MKIKNIDKIIKKLYNYYIIEHQTMYDKEGSNIYMNETNSNNNLEKILSLSKEELEKIFSQLSMIEIEELLNKLNEVGSDD